MASTSEAINRRRSVRKAHLSPRKGAQCVFVCVSLSLFLCVCVPSVNVCPAKTSSKCICCCLNQQAHLALFFHFTEFHLALLFHLLPLSRLLPWAHPSFWQLPRLHLPGVDFCLVHLASCQEALRAKTKQLAKEKCTCVWNT